MVHLWFKDTVRMSTSSRNVRDDLHQMVLPFDDGEVIVYDRSAGWSSLVARWAHNPKVGGSNPPPATNSTVWFQWVEPISQLAR
jgi:hypothetical protein